MLKENVNNKCPKCGVYLVIKEKTHCYTCRKSIEENLGIEYFANIDCEDYFEALND